MSFLDIFKRSKEEVRTVADVQQDESSATSFVIRGLNPDGPSTSLSPFFAAKELISNSIASLPILVKRDDALDKEHPLNLVFKTGMISKFMLIKKLIEDAIMHGNGYAYIKRAKDGTPTELIYCEKGTCTAFYTQNKRELYYRIPFISRSRIEPCDVIHVYKTTNNGVVGDSLIKFAENVLSLSKSTDRAARNYYSSGCAVQGALTIKGARKGSKEQARRAFAETHSGSNASGIVILDDDMSYTPLSSNANDSQMLESRSFNITEIARFFNINPVLLGDLSHSSYSTIEAANIEFVQRTLNPYICILQDEFNRKLVKPSETSITIDFDETKLLGTDKTTMSNYLKTLTSAGILSINEARKILGMAPIEGGDEHIIPFTDINQNKVEGEDEETNSTEDIQNEEEK